MIDYKAYGKRFLIMSRILRGFGSCAICGAKNGEANPATGSKVVLTVHHFDMSKDNNDLFNLAPLCQKCHLDAHRGAGRIIEWHELSVDYHVWVDMLMQFFCFIVPHKDIKP